MIWMPMKKSAERTIIVTGDVTVDWFIAQGKIERENAWNRNVESKLWCGLGGAALLHEVTEGLLKAMQADAENTYSLHRFFLSPEDVSVKDPRFHHSYSLWFPFSRKDGAPAWRIGRFLGFDPCDSVEVPKETGEALEPSILIIDDAALGFRANPEQWPQAIRSPDAASWIVVKMAKPVAEGQLWEHLLRHAPDRLIVLTTIDDLRQSEVQISRQLSWERTAQDILWELTHNPRVNGLSRCAHVIVSLGAAGAIHLSQQDGKPLAMLLFDTQCMEGEWENEHPGGMFGYTTCLTAAICRQVIFSPEDPDIPLGIQTGVSALRRLHLEGFGNPGTNPQGAEIHFPVEKVVGEISADGMPLASAMVQDPVQNILSPSDSDRMRVMAGFWTILEDHYTDSLNEVAQRIVLDGIQNALINVPLGRFGALVTVDRREIEALRTIASLISQYCQLPQQRPLNISVFGPPGSGKSFGVKQIAKSARPGEIDSITFNISQFQHPDELLDALHQVRDIGLSGKIPLVFWDEFDTPLDGKPLGWLRYFLAPMQDGSFQEGQIVHPIGRAIFVFAGGTSHCMEEFGENLDEVEQRAAKLPDFISRLKGYLNVLGPNPIEGQRDPYYILRRAIILRVLFELNVPQIVHKEDGVKRVQIDHGILRALLNTQRFKHGVRSIESILAMSNLAGKERFERSDLPPEDQLDLHVEGREFLALVQQMPLEGVLLEKLAEAAHEIFCDGLRTQGYTLGSSTDSNLKTHDALKPYQELREDEKESNRDSVRDIANKLAAVGYVMMPARSNEPPFEFPGDDLDFLAQMEHERWMRDKVRHGWTYGEKTDKDKKVHESLEPWEDLSEEERDKDREMIRGIPKILAKAGYAIVKI
jgi:hypothetical protein